MNELMINTLTEGYFKNLWSLETRAAVTGKVKEGALDKRPCGLAVKDEPDVTRRGKAGRASAFPPAGTADAEAQGRGTCMCVGSCRCSVRLVCKMERDRR